MRRLEGAELELGVHVFEAMAQYVQGAVGVELFGNPFNENRLRLPVVPALELRPLSGLGLLDKCQQVGGVDGELSVV